MSGGPGFWTDASVREALGLPAPAAGAEPVTYSGVATDTRQLEAGALFVALRGERFDGHDFVAEAVAKGARGVVVSRRVSEMRPGSRIRWYEVPDTLVALGRLAFYRRRRLAARVCAITGTVGKTTTKEMLRAALSASYRVHATTGNLNNLVGTPLTLLAAPDDAEALVIEVGTNAPGEIARLAAIVEPDAAIITAIGEGHLQGLGTIAGVLEEKVSLLGGLEPGGLALVADEPPQLQERARQFGCELLVAGFSDRADEEVRGRDLVVDDDGRVSFEWSGRSVRLEARGRANARNALLALGLAKRWGVDVDAAIEKLAAVGAPSMRSEVRNVGPIRVIADCYNSNPSSLQAAIDLLTSMRKGSGRVAMVGSMLELGPRSAELHRRAATALADADVDLIVATGEFVSAFEPIAARLGDRLIAEADPLAAYARLAPRLRPDSVVLLKASRGVALERVLREMERDWAGENGVPAGGHEHGPAGSGADAHGGDARAKVEG